MGKSNYDISVVLPVYQEKDSIEGHISNLISILTDIDKSVEIIAVNDGSQDGTGKRLNDLSAEYPKILRVIHHPYNKGNGEAIKTGIRNAVGELIVCMDSDGQHDPKDLKELLPYMKEYDLVVGSRTSLYKGSWSRNFANRIYNWLASKLTNFKILDLTSGYRVFNAQAIKKFVDILPSKFSYPTTSTLTFLKYGYNVKFVPIDVKTRKSGGTDTPHNLMPLCQKCHTYIHMVGLNKAARDNFGITMWLRENDWEFCELYKKWRHV